MNGFDLAPTRTTPKVSISAQEGKLELKGKSSPESSIDFYSLVIEKLKVIFDGYEGVLNSNIAFEYINTSTTKCLFDLLGVLKSMHGDRLVVNWYYEEGDDDMLETGEDFEDVLELKFNFFAVPDLDEV
jgi:hypothetical protein